MQQLKEFVMGDMKRYIGTKIINAKSMNRLDYNVFRGWELPADENGKDEGYLVEYIDGGKANTKEYKGYVSWSPKDVFDKAYKEAEGLNFGDAITAMKIGLKVSRVGWNGKSMFLYMKPAGEKVYEGVKYKRQAYIVMKTAQDMLVPWFAIQSDILGEDWYVVQN